MKWNGNPISIRPGRLRSALRDRILHKGVGYSWGLHRSTATTTTTTALNWGICGTQQGLVLTRYRVVLRTILRSSSRTMVLELVLRTQNQFGLFSEPSSEPQNQGASTAVPVYALWNDDIDRMDRARCVQGRPAVALVDLRTWFLEWF